MCICPRGALGLSLGLGGNRPHFFGTIRRLTTHGCLISFINRSQTIITRCRVQDILLNAFLDIFKKIGFIVCFYHHENNSMSSCANFITIFCEIQQNRIHRIILLSVVEHFLQIQMGSLLRYRYNKIKIGKKTNRLTNIVLKQKHKSR